jgi:hypothetical protein
MKELGLLAADLEPSTDTMRALPRSATRAGIW